MNDLTADHYFTAPFLSSLKDEYPEATTSNIYMAADIYIAEQVRSSPSQDPTNLAAYNPPIERKFTLEPHSGIDKYSATKFQGVLVDTGAAGHSTAGVEQLKALQKLRPGLKLDRKRANECRVKGIGDGVFSSLGAVDVQTPIGMVTFHIIPCNIPFLLSLKDMDRLQSTADTQINSMVQRGKVKARLLRHKGGNLRTGF